MTVLLRNQRRPSTQQNHLSAKSSRKKLAARQPFLFSRANHSLYKQQRAPFVAGAQRNSFYRDNRQTIRKFNRSYN